MNEATAVAQGGEVLSHPLISACLCVLLSGKRGGGGGARGGRGRGRRGRGRGQ